MAKPLNLTGPYRNELAELADVASHLAAGNGGPSRYRKPASGMSALPDYGRADLNVVCMEVPHRPMAALLVAALMLYGLHFQDDLERMGIHEISVEVFEALQREFGRASSVAFDAGNRLALSSAPRGTLTAALAQPAHGTTVRTITFADQHPRSAGALRAPTSSVSLPASFGLPALPPKR